MDNEYKSGLSRKERHIIQMGYEAEDGLKNQNEFYVYQNKIKNKINGTFQDTILILKNSNTVFELDDEIQFNAHQLIEMRNECIRLLEKYDINPNWDGKYIGHEGKPIN